MTYDGLGNRLAMTGYADGQSVSTQYVLDQGKVLLATANSQTTAYLYGLGVIGSQTDAWSYLLPDGLNSSRQLADASGQITQAASYTPWGDTWAVNGASLAYGYLGGMMDTATGLIYVGNGQYYDPSTGRFLTRDANPNQTNPYVPWKSDPTSLLISPLALLALVYSGKRKRSKMDIVVVLMVVCGVLGLGLAGCGPTTPGGGTPGIVTPPPAEQPGQSGTEYPSTPTPGGTPIETPTYDCTPTPTPIDPSPSQTTDPTFTEWERNFGQSIASAAESILINRDNYYVWGMEDKVDEVVGWPPPLKVPEEGDKWGYNNSIDVKERTGGRIPVVCADVVAIAYENGGMNLASYTDWFYSKKYTNIPTRNSYALKDLVYDKGILHTWGNNTYPELGDMVFFKDPFHTGVISEIAGDHKDPANIFVVQASYSQGVINKMTLLDWQKGNEPVLFGHPSK